MRVLILVFWTAFLCNYAGASVTVSVNGSSHTIPQTNEKGWGTNVTAWIQAISQYTLQNSGGTFTLTAEVDTGATYGFKVPYIKTRTASPATAGVLRLANTDSIGFRNAGDSGNLLLAADSSNRLTWNGTVVPTPTAASFQDSTFSIYDNGDATRLIAFQASGITAGQTRTVTVPDANVNLGALTNSNIDASAAIAYSKLNLSTSILNADVNASAAIATSKLAATTASRAAVTDGSGFLTAASATTSTEIGYVNGVTSAIQTQLDAKQLRSTLTTKGDLYVATASNTVARQGVGSDGTFLKADSGQTNGVIWASVAGVALVTVTRDTTDTVDSGEDVVLLTASGGAWTSTLYTAVGNTGKILRFAKTGNNTTAVTIDGNSSETIGGVATIQLVNIGDHLTIVSDGANWQIISSKITAYTHLHTPNGYGSTNTKITKYTTSVSSLGNAFTVSNDATNGLSVTINLPGTYAFSSCQEANAASISGLSLNSSELTTNITAITTADALCMTDMPAANQVFCCSWSGNLKAGDVVRPHSQGTAVGTVPSRAHFHAARMN